jgi:putative peptidoglycan binding protein
MKTCRIFFWLFATALISWLPIRTSFAHGGFGGGGHLSMGGFGGGHPGMGRIGGGHPGMGRFGGDGHPGLSGGHPGLSGGHPGFAEGHPNTVSFPGGRFHDSGQRFFAGGHRFSGVDHRFAHGDRDRDDHFFHHRNQFFFGFNFAAFGFPDWWYPWYPYYGYPYDYDYSDYSPVYDYRYWSGLATAVQTQLTARGYYHGPIDGVIGSESREAIRAFQKSQGLPVSGLIEPSLLKALNLPAVPRVA